MEVTQDYPGPQEEARVFENLWDPIGQEGEEKRPPRWDSLSLYDRVEARRCRHRWLGAATAAGARHLAAPDKDPDLIIFQFLEPVRSSRAWEGVSSHVGQSERR